MARRRGFFAELQHQAAVAERNRQRAAAAEFRQHQQWQREAQRLAAASQRTREQAARADARTRAALEKEQAKLYAEAQAAEAEAMTAEATAKLREIDDVLLATLDVDDYVDLESLRAATEHPPFESAHLTPLPAPSPTPWEPLPTYYPPSGLGRRTGRRAEDSRRADQTFMLALYERADRRPAVERADAARLEDHAEAERQRLARVQADRATYDQQCRVRQAETDRRNGDLDDLIRRFAASDPAAVEEYFSIVLGNSAYPDDLDIDHQFNLDARARELTITVELPHPDDLPADKAFRYVKARDEITPVAQTQTERRNRYAALVANVSMRTIHELYEADRADHLRTVSLTAGVHHTDPATGRSTFTTLLAVAVDRDDFESLILDRVDAAASLRHLGAVISCLPSALTSIGTSAGVRTR